MNTRLSKCRGFFLYEMVLVVFLVGVLAILLGDLFQVSFSAFRDTGKRENLVNRMDSAIALLRRDTWSASAISLDGAKRADLDLPAGQLVSWRISPDGTLSRTLQNKGNPEQSQSWPGLPEMHFASSGPTLTLTVRAAPGRDDTLTLVSQQLLQGRPK